MPTIKKGGNIGKYVIKIGLVPSGLKHIRALDSLNLHGADIRPRSQCKKGIFFPKEKCKFPNFNSKIFIKK